MAGSIRSLPLATEGDEHPFTWSHSHGSNSGRILAGLAVPADASRTTDLYPKFVEEKKIREMLDSLLQESDVRSCQIAFPAQMDAEQRTEQEPIDDVEGEEEEEEASAADRTPLYVPDKGDEAKAMGPHLEKQTE